MNFDYFQIDWIWIVIAITTYRLPTILISYWIFIFVLFLTFIVIDVFGIVAFGIFQRNIWLCFVFFDVDCLVEEIVDDVVFRWLLANIIAGWWHTNQMDLMEDKTFRTHPRMLLIFLTVMEHLAVYTFVGIVSNDDDDTNNIINWQRFFLDRTPIRKWKFRSNLPGATFALECWFFQKQCQTIGLLDFQFIFEAIFCILLLLWLLRSVCIRSQKLLTS